MGLTETTKRLVSVIIPCYNHANYLEEAIQSVLNSTYPALEIIVVDDGSTDNSGEIARKIMRSHSNIHYFYQENTGPSAARNQGIRMSKGAFILPLDADDKIAEQYIEKAVDVLTRNDDVKIVYCDAEFFGGRSGPWKLKKFSARRMALRNMIFSCALYRRSDFERSGGYNEDLIHGHEDWDFWIAMIKDGGHAFKLEGFTGFFYRIHDHSRRRSTARDYKYQSFGIIYQRHHAFMVQQLKGPIRNPRMLTIPVNNLLRLIKIPVKILTEIRNRIQGGIIDLNATRFKKA